MTTTKTTASRARENRKLATARDRARAANEQLATALKAVERARATRARAMTAMYANGASYRQVGEVVGMTPMSARSIITGS